MSSISVQPNAIDDVKITDLGNSLVVGFRHDMSIDFQYETYPYKLRFPDGFNLDVDLIAFYFEKIPLNEFGLYYVALYICSNLSRYYPDLWMKELELNTDLAIAIMNLLNVARERVPLLSFIELSETQYFEL